MTSMRRKSTATRAKRRKSASGSARQARKNVTRSARTGRKVAVRRPKRAVRKTATPRLTVLTGKRARRAKVAARAASAVPSFPQRKGASPKQLVLFEIVRARAAVLGAIQGLTAGSANQPMGEGKWSVCDTVLHLVTRDQARMREGEAALRGHDASWKGVKDPEMSVINAELMAPLRALDWDEALRLLHRTRDLLMEELESVPEEPADVWSPDHPFGWMLQALPPHDRHHADVIKRWRAEHGA
jgi:hypothetical protein